MTIRQGDNPADESKFLAMRVSALGQRIGEDKDGAALRAPNFEPAIHRCTVLAMQLLCLNRRGVA